MSAAMRVKCKGCQATVFTSPLDSPRTLSDGTPVNAAKGEKCGVTNLCKPPTPKPAEELDSPADRKQAPANSPQVVRLPTVVLEAAWLVRLTLNAVWVVLIAGLVVAILSVVLTLLYSR